MYLTCDILMSIDSVFNFLTEFHLCTDMQIIIGYADHLVTIAYATAVQ